jgi:hypothetical protein
MCITFHHHHDVLINSIFKTVLRLVEWYLLDSDRLVGGNRELLSRWEVI